MSELDKKLEEILETGATIYDGGGKMFFTYDDIVKHIKQAFVDDGWINWLSLPEGIYVHTATSFSQVAAGNFMTGEEWFEKFNEEFTGDHILPELVEYRGQVMRAARNASGIK